MSFNWYVNPFFFRQFLQILPIRKTQFLFFSVIGFVLYEKLRESLSEQLMVVVDMVHDLMVVFEPSPFWGGFGTYRNLSKQFKTEMVKRHRMDRILIGRPRRQISRKKCRGT